MAADKKRKGADKSKSATPAKKRKVETTKAKPAAKKNTPKRSKAATPKVTSTKVKKPDPKSKTPAKKTKTPVKAAASKTQKSATKASKTPTKSPVKKQVKTKKEIPKKAAVQPKSQSKPKVAASVTRAKLDKAKTLKAKAAITKAKLKSTKTLPKGKVIKTQKPVVKKTVKPEEKKVDNKDTKEKKTITKNTPVKKPAAEEKKRKAESQDSSESSRKRRNITPNKKFADFELDVPAKRTITPNKKYADYETESLPKSGKVSELRAFIQEKKTSKPEKEPTPKAEKKKTPVSTPKAGKDTTVSKESSTLEEKIKVFKPSEMKPAEKLLKKLQKKLEKEAKGSAPATPQENREKAKIKITKVVDYNKPLSSEDVEMKKLAKKEKVAAAKAKAATPIKPKQTPKALKSTDTVPQKPKATPTTKVVKATPKTQQVEKVVKPKKIKDMKREERPIQAKFVCQKLVQLPDDNQKVQCWVTGISVFPSGEIIMVDMSNRKIKLFSKDFEFLSAVVLDAIPQDISVSPVNACSAYFTKPFSKEGIQKVIMSDGKLALKEFFVTNGTNRGITCTKAGILTSVQDGRYHDVDINHFKIYLLDYTGKVLQSVSTDPTGSRLFKLPLYFTVSSTGKQMIVADCIKQNSYVLSVDMDGKIKFKYEGLNNNPITPRGLTIDDNDNIYVTEWERNNVYILSPAGKRLQLLFSHLELQQEKVDGLIKPYQLCYYKFGEDKRLIVSQESCNTVKVFKLLSKTEMEAENAAAAALKKVEEATKAKEIAAEVKEKNTPPETKTAQAKPVEKATVVTVSPSTTNSAKVETISVTAKGPVSGNEQVVNSAKPAVATVQKPTPTVQKPTPTVVKVVTVAQSVPVPTVTVKQPVTVPTKVVVPQVDNKKDDIFANTADDFKEETNASEPEVNGNLQDIVNAFPGEGEIETANPPTMEIIPTAPPPQMTPMEMTPETVVEAVVEQTPEQPQSAIIEQVVVQADPVTDQALTDPPVADSNELVGNIVQDPNTNIIETVVVSEAPVDNAFENFQTIVYESVPQDGNTTIVDEQGVIETTVTSEQQVVTTDTVYVPEYQNVVTEVPVELETMANEYVV